MKKSLFLLATLCFLGVSTGTAVAADTTAQAHSLATAQATRQATITVKSTGGQIYHQETICGGFEDVMDRAEELKAEYEALYGEGNLFILVAYGSAC
ncbi:hypothetical protein ACKUSY_01840 [Myroides odoratus]